MQTDLKGVENFYAISYMWLLSFGAIVTGVIGIIASFIMSKLHSLFYCDLCATGDDWLEQVNKHDEYLFPHYVTYWVLVGDWLEQVGHGSRLVRASWS